MSMSPNQRFDRRLHIYVFLSQIVLMFYILVVMRLIERELLPIPLSWGKAVMLILLILLHYLAFVTVRAHLKNLAYTIAYGILIFGGFVLLHIAGITNNLNLYILSDIMTLIAVLIWQYFVIRDIFTQEYDMWSSILGAANIYWLFIFVFGYFYSLLELFYPGMLGAQVPGGMMGMLNACFKLSGHVMVGMDPPYPAMDEVMSNVTLFQAATSNLYIIFVVGKLFSR